ncbi:MAG: hypothetical protein ABII82_20935, partial [Verrucomicrobiota bacterium]
MKDKIEIDGVEYVSMASIARAIPAGTRAVVVVDRGWIFAGDVTEENGRIYLDRAVWVFRWERIGFAAALDNPTADGVDIRPVSHRVDIPAASEVYRVPVRD